LAQAPVHLHLGLYAYRRQALTAYKESVPSSLEELEGLEQLRFLASGHPVAVVLSEPVDWDSVELNNPSDVAAVERELARRGLA
jgi:3-deoxy-manno-octulosonate cytidylyltransferase (CMP-KDO synthetase)